MNKTPPSPADLAAQLLQHAAGVEVVAVATVESYDSAAARATVRPLHKSGTRDARTGTVAWTERPPLSVPVLWPAGGGTAITWPLEAGDFVLLLVCGRSLDEFSQGQGPPAIEAGDVRRNSLQDALALPLLPRPLPADASAEGATVVTGDDIRLGDSTATEAVALAPPVEANLAVIRAYLAVLATAGTGGSVASSAYLAAIAAAPSSVGAERVKAR